MPLNIPPQKSFLYKANWTHALDESLLETIIRLKFEHDMEGTVIPKPFFDIAAADMAYDLGVIKPWDALYDRLQFLENRYLSFKVLLNEVGTVWDEPNNVVIATDETWSAIFQRNKLAGAYYHLGEPAFSQLSILFGPKEIKQEQSNEVIVVSDTTAPAVETEPVGQEGEGNTEETIISPILPNEPKSRRKLFDEEHSNGDRESCNERPEYYYAVAPDGKMKMRQPPIRPRQVRGRPPMPNASPAGSSCASSSPIGWWRNLGK